LLKQCFWCVFFPPPNLREVEWLHGTLHEAAAAEDGKVVVKSGEWDPNSASKHGRRHVFFFLAYSFFCALPQRLPRSPSLYFLAKLSLLAIFFQNGENYVLFFFLLSQRSPSVYFLAKFSLLAIFFKKRLKLLLFF